MAFQTGGPLLRRGPRAALFPTETLPNSRSGVVPAGTVGIRGALRSGEQNT